MGENTLAVEIREAAGKGVARKLRAAGRVPAVLYGQSTEAISLSLDPARLDRLIHASDAGLNTLIDLEGDQRVAGKTVLVKDMQRDPVRGAMLHADLYEVDLSETIVVEVPVHVFGTPIGVTLSGGILDQSLREIELECLPRAIPDEIRIDVSGLEVGDSVHVRDLPLPGGVELRTDPERTVASVVTPAAAEAEAAGAAAAPAEGEAVAGEGVAEAAGEKAGDDNE